MATDPSGFTPAPAPASAPPASPPANAPATATVPPTAVAAPVPIVPVAANAQAPTSVKSAVTPIIEIKGLTKRYRDLVAVRDLNLTIEPGEVFGFIGPNGAGKTTTIKSLATLLEFTSGSVKVDGIDVLKHPLEVRRIIGYMPDFFGVYDDVKVWEYLDFFAAAYKIPANKRKAIIDDVLELTDLTEKREAYVEGLSRGMKQRLCLAKTLVHDPKLLLLDEPASGLDPRARIEFRALLKELRQMGKTIFVSSHILPELADFCTSVGIMERGQLVVAGRVHDIVQKLEGSILLDVRLTGDNENGARALDVVRAHPLVKEAKAEGNHLTVSFIGTNDELPQLLATLIQNNLPVASFGQREADLEDVFMRVTKGMVQ